MSDGLGPEDLSEAQLRRLAQSPLARLALACAEVSDAAAHIKQNDLMWDRLVEDVADNTSRISSVDTSEEILESFLEQIEEYAALAEAEEDPGGGSSTDPACANCGTDLGGEWRDANRKARRDGEHPADCPECGGNPLPRVGGEPE